MVAWLKPMFFYDKGKPVNFVSSWVKFILCYSVCTLYIKILKYLLIIFFFTPVSLCGNGATSVWMNVSLRMPHCWCKRQQECGDAHEFEMIFFLTHVWQHQGVGLEFAKSQTAVKNSENRRKLVVKSSVVPQWPSWLRDRWWWWWSCMINLVPSVNESSVV